MPKQVYNFNIRGNNLGSSIRLETREQAQAIYDAVNNQLGDNDGFIELKLGEDIASVRANDITGFGISVSFEETAEERKQRAIARVEQELSYSNQCDQGYATEAVGVLARGSIFK